MSSQINNFPGIVEDKFNRSESYSDIINSLVDKSTRLIIPTNSFMNFYTTNNFPRYELRKFEFTKNELSNFNNINFSIKDRFELLNNPVRVFIKDNSIYIGHLPDNSEVCTEIFIFLSVYLNRLSSMIEAIQSNEYLSWDNNRRYKPIVKVNLPDKVAELSIDNNLLRFIPQEIIDKGVSESKSIRKFMFICGSDSLIQYLNEETN